MAFPWHLWKAPTETLIFSPKEPCQTAAQQNPVNEFVCGEASWHVPVCNPSAWEVKAAGQEFKTSLGYMRSQV